MTQEIHRLKALQYESGQKIRHLENEYMDLTEKHNSFMTQFHQLQEKERVLN
jgi:hypothetical protein